MSAPLLCLNGFNGSPYLGAEEDLPGWIAATAAAGFPLFAPDRFSLEAWAARGGTLAELSKRMHDAGIGCGFIAAVGMLDDGDASGELNWARQVAEVLGTRLLQINLAAVTPEARLAAVERACDVLEGSGMRLAIEYMPISPLVSVRETVAIVQQVGTDRAGAMIDIWHHSRGPDSWDDLAAVPADTIAYVELNDALPLQSDALAAETVSRRVFPGEGEFDVARFVRTLRAIGYRGMASVEILNEAWRDKPIKEFAAKAYQSAAAIWVK
jgi:sugar phosphate isomerase/epimerase